MPPLKCLIVDDEDLAIDLIADYVQRTEGLQIAGTCFHALKAEQFLSKNKADILLLDIQMPFMTGLELVKRLSHPPFIIFTTSYSEYAVQAFELKVMDYLLKPFTYERFVQAIDKVKDYVYLHNPSSPQPADFFFVKSDSVQVKVLVDDVLYVEGLKQYVKIVTNSGVVITLEAMKRLEELLPAQQFLRIHKSYIIALNKIQTMSRRELVIAGRKIPVGKTYEAAWVKRMSEMQR